MHEHDETKLIPWSRLTGVVVTAGDVEEGTATWWSLEFRLEFGDRKFEFENATRSSVRGQHAVLLAFATDKLAASGAMTWA